MMMCVWIFIGSGLGGVARYLFGNWVNASVGDGFPWGTVAINILGSLIIGFFATLTLPDGRFAASHATRQFVMIGLCGGFTTFSSFSLQTLNLADQGDIGGASLNIALSVICCLAAVWLGALAASAVNSHG